MIKAFPKIFTIGTDYIKDIFLDEVEISEKLDGSQLDFGKIDNILYFRSKGKQLFPEVPEKMFIEGVDYILSIQDKLPNNMIFFCEYLKKSKHNSLTYGRIPKNHLMLFAVSGTDEKFYDNHHDYAKELDIEPANIFFKGKINNPEEIIAFLDNDSFLGNCKIEGMVVKNYQRPFLLGGQPIPIMSGKFVSEEFKEVHKREWKDKTTKGGWELLINSYKTEARWMKAVQHLRDDGVLENSPRDIGGLIKSIQTDIVEEEKENIKEDLWKLYHKDILRATISRFPEWYKEYLLKELFLKF